MITNLTQHAPTPDQAGVGPVLPDVPALLTFDRLPSHTDINRRVALLMRIARETGNYAAMIGGAPWVTGPLAAGLRESGITPLFAFSVRESLDVVQPDGSIRKTSVFRHVGWVEG